MVFSGRGRDVVKRMLRLSRVKVLHQRVTVTRFTAWYFWFTLCSCLVLAGLQGFILSDNTQAVGILSNLVRSHNMPPHLAIIQNGELLVCDGLPGQPATICGAPQGFLDGREVETSGSDFTRDWSRDRNGGQEEHGNFLKHPETFECVYSLSWLEEVLHDSKREDVAILFYQFWIFGLGVVTILNESLPHLWTSFAGHILGGTWAASRIQSTRNLITLYRTVMVPQRCGGFDPLGTWWEARLKHTIPIVAANGVSILIMGLLTWRLLKFYNTASFARVGASSQIHRFYKLVLLFSVGLQLAFFFSLAASGIWIDKILHADLRMFTAHWRLYLAAVVGVMVMALPFLILGWKSVRKESKILFGIVFTISLILVGITSVMFSSALYRYIFLTWQFFATVTITAFVFLVLTTGIGFICRLNFGKGLAEYLNVTDALEGVDFTLVYFPRRSDDIEKPEKAYGLDEKKDDLGQFGPNPMFYLSPGDRTRGVSVYSDNAANPVFLSSSPPLTSDLESPTKRTKRLTKAAARRQRGSRVPDWRSSFYSAMTHSSAESPSPTTVDPRRPMRALVSVKEKLEPYPTTTTGPGGVPILPVPFLRDRQLSVSRHTLHSKVTTTPEPF
ncbi:hypothetical protein FA15DRAFT_326581 [Coprinopsis marcescibilis]|uniref:Uncharacterized protein n=1 Tax=Coprinopsis marcescibilis TaxID=230819 RepID=A0A5C3KC91_COPMA|nr:hypothetical protein FA15DRAFT_326581 [Coprinopsis marcescibilis]